MSAEVCFKDEFSVLGVEPPVRIELRVSGAEQQPTGAFRCRYDVLEQPSGRLVSAQRNVYGETSLQALLLCIVVGATEVDVAIRDAGGRPDPDEWSTIGRLVRRPV